MPLQLPNLDDTDFEALLQQALAHIDGKLHANWTAASESDPGRVLVEAFAYLTDQMIYRMNRLPEKVYVAFLRLLGVTQRPPAAARVALAFTPLPRELPAGVRQWIEVPRGTRIGAAAGDGAGDMPVFITERPLEIPLRTAESDAPPTATVMARHCTWVELEAVGRGTGEPGLTLAVARPPITAPHAGVYEVAVWVARSDDAPPPDDGDLDRRRYRRWEETTSFGAHTAGQAVYVLDRFSGQVHFAPEIEPTQPEGPALRGQPRRYGAVPGRNHRILVSYPTGGGAAGNVRPGILTAVLDRVLLITEDADGRRSVTPQVASYFVTVTNPDRASGGRDAESLENALLRGPLAIYDRRQAITVRDYERIALESSAALARVHAVTQRDVWAFAQPGSVELLLVPAVRHAAAPAADGAAGEEVEETAVSAATPLLQALDLSTLQALIAEADLQPVREALQRSRVPGTRSALRWFRYKAVGVRATVTLQEHVSAPADVMDDVRQRLARFIHPFNNPDTEDATTDDTSWPYGRALQLEEVRRLIQDTDGVRRVETLELRFTAPERDVRCLVPDAHQPRTWYAGSGDTLFRSTNDGLGWEALRPFPGERIQVIQPNSDCPGLLGLATRVMDEGSPARARVYVSTNCGTDWERVTDFNYGIDDLDWLLRANLTILLLATDRGLYEFKLTHEPEARPELDVPSLVPVDPAAPKAAIYALAVVRGQRGQARVAVALKQRGGVYVSGGADLVPAGLPGLAAAELADLGLAGEAARADDIPGGGVQVRFRPLPALAGRDVRHLAVQQDGTRRSLWAGLMAEGNQADGCYRFQLDSGEGGLVAAGSWQGGSCRGLAFDDTWVYAATQWGGVMKLKWGDAAARWVPSTQLDPAQFDPFMRSLDDQRPDYAPDWDGGAVDDADDPAIVRQIFRPYEPLLVIGLRDGTLMAGGAHGILRTRPGRTRAAADAERLDDPYTLCSAATISRYTAQSEVTIPYDWLFVSG
ncbi:MAG: hypothetical protein KC425_21685, partial [Anaerolineales bacterium]|nr:hypothetical protein [Anaerolineales bacterium]